MTKKLKKPESGWSFPNLISPTPIDFIHYQPGKDPLRLDKLMLETLLK